MHAATLDSLALYEPSVLDAAVAAEYDSLDAAGFFDTIRDAFNSVATKVKKGWATAKKYIAAGLDSPIGQQIMNYASAIPGYGTAISAGLGALSAAAKGKNLAEIGMEAAKKALPGGFVKDMIVNTAGNALSNIIKGKGAGGAITGALGGAAKTGIAKLMPKGMPPTIANIISGAAGSMPDMIGGALGLGQKHHKLLAGAHAQGQAKNVAAALLQNPNLRSLGTSALAKQLGTTPTAALTGQRAIFRLAGVMGRPAPGASTDAGAMFAGEPAPFGDGMASRVFRSRPRPARAVPFDAFESSRLTRSIPILRRSPQFLRVLQAVPLARSNDAGAIDPTNPRLWIVTSGETLSSISTKLGHPGEPMVMYAVNKAPVGPLTDPGKIYVGQKLRVPDSWLPNLPTGPSPAPGPSPVPGMQLHHIVQAGETLSSIAADFGHPGEAMAIYAENKYPTGPLGSPDHIQVGQLLKMPDGWTAPAKGPLNFPAPQPSPSPAPVPLPDSKIVAEAQARLAYWNVAYHKATPSDYGQPSDFTGTITPRFTSAVRSFQLWSNQTLGSSLRTDGVLDEPTHAQLAYVSGNINGQGLPVPPSIPGAPPPVPPPPPPGPVPVPGPLPSPPDDAPPWYIPGTDPSLYKLPNGQWESYPGQAKGLPVPPGWPGGQLPPNPGPLPWPGPNPPPEPAPKRGGGGGAAIALLALLGIGAGLR